MSVGLEVDPVDRTRRDVVAQIQQRDRDPVLFQDAAAASMNAWLSRWDSRSASGDSPWSHVPSGANGGGTSTRTAGAPSARPASLASTTSASFIAPCAAWYAFTPGRNRSFVPRSITTSPAGDGVCSATGRYVRPLRSGSNGTSNTVVRPFCPSSITCTSSPSSRCRTPGHRSHRPRRSARGGLDTPRCSSRRSRGSRSRYSAMSIRSITTSSTGRSCAPTGVFAIDSTTS